MNSHDFQEYAALSAEDRAIRRIVRACEIVATTHKKVLEPGEEPPELWAMSLKPSKVASNEVSETVRTLNRQEEHLSSVGPSSPRQRHFHLDIGYSTKIAVNVPNRKTLTDTVRKRLVATKGFALARINLDHLVALRTSESFRKSYAAQDLVVADGNPIVWLSRMAKRPVALAPMPELVIPLARIAAENGVPLALLGATAPVLAKAADALKAEIPGLEIAAALAPSQNFGPEGAEADGLLTKLERSGAGLTLLALGSPCQETFAARGRLALPGMGFVSIGDGLDELAGSLDRAPVWARRLALEWLWRLLVNPRRLAQRYLNCALIMPRLITMALRQRSKISSDRFKQI